MATLYRNVFEMTDYNLHNDTALQTNLKHSMRTAMSFPELVEHGWLLSEEVFKLKLKRRFEVNQMFIQSTMQWL